MTMRRMMIWVVATCLVAVLVPASASADGFRLRVEDLTPGQPGAGLGYGVVITDQMTGDINAAVGVLTKGPFALSSNVNISTNTGTSKPVLPTSGTGLFSQLNLLSTTIHFSGPGPATIRLTLEDTGFTAGVGGALTLTNWIRGTFQGGASGASATTQAWASATNAVPDLGANQVSSGALSAIGANVGDAHTTRTFGGTLANIFDYTDSTSFNALTPGPYSLFTQITLSFTTAGSFNFEQDTFAPVTAELIPPVSVPEPSTLLLLLGTGIVGLAGGSRRRRASRAQAA